MCEGTEAGAADLGSIRKCPLFLRTANPEHESPVVLIASVSVGPFITVAQSRPPTLERCENQRASPRPSSVRLIVPQDCPVPISVTRRLSAVVLLIGENAIRRIIPPWLRTLWRVRRMRIRELTGRLPESRAD